MKNSPATFQRLIHLVCASDDVVIYTDAWADRIFILEPVFQWLTQASSTLNYAKCEIGKAIVTYLAKQVDLDRFVQWRQKSLYYWTIQFHPVCLVFLTGCTTRTSDWCVGCCWDRINTLWSNIRKASLPPNTFSFFPFSSTNSRTVITKTLLANCTEGGRSRKSHSWRSACLICKDFPLNALPDAKLHIYQGLPYKVISERLSVQSTVPIHKRLTGRQNCKKKMCTSNSDDWCPAASPTSLEPWLHKLRY